MQGSAWNKTKLQFINRMIFWRWCTIIKTCWILTNEQVFQFKFIRINKPIFTFKKSAPIMKDEGEFSFNIKFVLYKKQFSTFRFLLLYNHVCQFDRYQYVWMFRRCSLHQSYSLPEKAQNVLVTVKWFRLRYLIKVFSWYFSCIKEVWKRQSFV